MARFKLRNHNKVGHPVVIYGTNFLGGAILNYLHIGLAKSKVVQALPSPAIFNTLGGLVFGGIRLVDRYIPSLGINDDNRYVRLMRAGGACIYGISALMELTGVLRGNLNRLWYMVPDAMMTYQLGAETLRAYQTHEFRKDLSDTRRSLENLVERHRNPNP